MAGRRSAIWIEILRTGILLIFAGSLLFLYQIPWTWMRESSPLLAYGSDRITEEDSFLCNVITEHIPLYSYAGCENVVILSLQSTLTEEEIRLAEARDEESEEVIEGIDIDVMKEMERENQHVQKTTNEESKMGADLLSEISEEQKDSHDIAEVISGGVNSEKHVLDMAKYSDFNMVLKDFYVVDRTTYITEEELNITNMLNYDLRLSDIKQDGEMSKEEEPKILIYHTHSQEAYADSVPGDKKGTVVGAGEKLAEILQGEYGIPTLHHTGEYDVESRDYAYANVTPELERILEEHPSIEVIIDLHRDGVSGDTRLVTELDGKPTAQFMFFNGLSRLSSTGEIDYLKNENRSGNLAFSFQLQLKCEEYYPGLARSIYLKGYRYNMQYKERSLLVELGAQTNTVEEVYNALPPLAHVISMVLLGE